MTSLRVKSKSIFRFARKSSANPAKLDCFGFKCVIFILRSIKNYVKARNDQGGWVPCQKPAFDAMELHDPYHDSSMEGFHWAARMSLG